MYDCRLQITIWFDEHETYGQPLYRYFKLPFVPVPEIYIDTGRTKELIHSVVWSVKQERFECLMLDECAFGEEVEFEELIDRYRWLGWRKARSATGTKPEVKTASAKIIQLNAYQLRPIQTS